MQSELTSVPPRASWQSDSWLARSRTRLQSVPYSVVAVVARVAVFVVFWRSGSVKLDDWSATLDLFTNEYRVPLLPAPLAAQLSVCLELGGSVLVLVGLASRLATLALLGMVSVIQLFVYPTAWPTHIQWLAFMLPLFLYGPGWLSLDQWILHRLQLRSQPGPASDGRGPQ